MSFQNNSFKDLKQTKQKFQFCHIEQNKGAARHQRQKLNMDHVTTKKETEVKAEKSRETKTVGTLQD